jgi:lantibiotic biosynthesis protein
LWAPIDCDEILIQSRASICDITAALQIMEAQPLGTFHLGERALLYAYLGIDDPSEDWQDRAIGCLNRGIEQLASSRSSGDGLFGGLAGFGWMVQHVSTLLSEGDKDIEDPLLELDTHILKAMESENACRNMYDLISGFVGIGVYWIERLPNSSAITGIEQVLGALEKGATKTKGGITWFTPPELIPSTQIDRAPNGYYNLGVAHGLPGVIGLLAQVARLRLSLSITQRALTLLEGAVDWLMINQRQSLSGSRYSSWLAPGKTCETSRLAWCYGDLGIAGVLHCAEEGTNNCGWIDHTRQLLDGCLVRNSDNSLFDSALCHGALGIAHIYNRIFQSTKQDKFRQGTISWVRAGLALRKQGTGIGGYSAWRPDLSPPHQADASLLSGSIGVALVLLSLVAPIEPCWDRILLLSSRKSIFP